jgi:hypothetical protein
MPTARSQSAAACHRDPRVRADFITGREEADGGGQALPHVEVALSAVDGSEQLLVGGQLDGCGLLVSSIR